MKKCENVYNVV